MQLQEAERLNQELIERVKSLSLAADCFKASAEGFAELARERLAALSKCGEALERADQAYAACQLQRDNWHKIADERAAEIVRLQKLVAQLASADKIEIVEAKEAD